MNIWVFPKIGLPQNGWFIMENPIKMDDLGGTTIFGNTHFMFYLSCGQKKGLRKPWGQKKRRPLVISNLTSLELRVLHPGLPTQSIEMKKNAPEDIRINLRNILGENWELWWHKNPISEYLLRKYVDPTIICKTPSQFRCLGKLAMQNHTLFTTSICSSPWRPDGSVGEQFFDMEKIPASPRGSCLTLVPLDPKIHQEPQGWTRNRDSIHEELPCFIVSIFIRACIEMNWKQLQYNPWKILPTLSQTMLKCSRLFIKCTIK